MADPDLLSGIDGPRPLPDGLRHRLEDQLLHDRPRPLDAGLVGRLSDTLTRPAPDGRVHRRWDRRAKVAGGLAAAVLLVAGGIGLAVDRSGPPHPVSTLAGPAATAGPSTTGPTAGLAPAASANGAASPGAAAGGANPAAGSAAAGPTAVAPFQPRTAPYIRSLTPDRGPAGGGTWVTIDGAGLATVTQVRFGGVPADRVTLVSPTSVRALSPAHPAGPVPVEIVTPTGSGYGSFTYTAG